nr:MAG TPA: hypothetical protein [Caudoviricetes sp.]
MNRYAIENLFGIKGLNIAWHGLIFLLAIKKHNATEF